MKVLGYIKIEYTSYSDVHTYGIVLDNLKPYAVSARVELPKIGEDYVFKGSKTWSLFPRHDKFRELTKLESLLLEV